MGRNLPNQALQAFSLSSIFFSTPGCATTCRPKLLQKGLIIVKFVRGFSKGGKIPKQLCSTHAIVGFKIRPLAVIRQTVCVRPLAVIRQTVCVRPLAVIQRTACVRPLAVIQRTACVRPLAVIQRTACVRQLAVIQRRACVRPLAVIRRTACAVIKVNKVGLYFLCVISV